MNQASGERDEEEKDDEVEEDDQLGGHREEEEEGEEKGGLRKITIGNEKKMNEEVVDEDMDIE